MTQFQSIFDPTFEAHCFRGIPPSEIMIPYPSIRSLLDSQMRWYGDTTFLIEFIDENNRIELSYNQLFQKVSQGANYLTSHGISFGDRVLLDPHNKIQSIIQFFAVWMVGATAVISEETENEKIQTIKNFTQSITPFPGEIESMDSLLSEYSTHYKIGKKSKLDDEVMIVCKFGEDGKMNYITLSHYNILVNAMAVVEWFDLKPEIQIICNENLNQVSGIVGCVMAALYGGSPIFLNPIRNGDFLYSHQRIEKGKIIFTNANQLTLFSQIKQLNMLKTCQAIVCPHEGLTSHFLTQIHEQTGIKINVGFCLPEAACYVTFLPTDIDDDTYKKIYQNQTSLCIGMALHPNEVDIQNNLGESLSEGKKGEIVIQGHNVMKGYLNNKKATYQVFKYGWLKTGIKGFYLQSSKWNKLFYIDF